MYLAVNIWNSHTSATHQSILQDFLTCAGLKTERICYFSEFINFKIHIRTSVMLDFGTIASSPSERHGKS